MSKLLQQTKAQLQEHWIVVCAVLVVIIATIPAVLVRNHWLYNLEPYPDAFYYALMGQNWVEKGDLALWYQDSRLTVALPPFYSIVLGLGYLVWSPDLVTSFVGVNIILQILTVVLLYATLKQTTTRRLAVLVGILVYLSHPVIYWLPLVAMSENVALPLFALTLYGLTHPQTDKRAVLTVFGSMGLVATRFLAFTVAGASWLLVMVDILRKASKRTIVITVSCFLILGVVISAFLESRGLGPVSILYNSYLSISRQQYGYSFGNILTNATFYLNTLIGTSGRILWQSGPLSSGGFLILFLLGVCSTFSQKKWYFGFLLAGLSFVQVPLLLLYFTVDNRYLILILPVLALGIGWLFDSVGSYKQSLLLVFLALSILVQLMAQKSLIRELVVSNFFGKSTAWQHQAIVNFDQFANESSGEEIIITALPPFLIDAYQQEKYQVLPLSDQQEFIQKGTFVWGSDFQPEENLMIYYQQQLDSGRNLFISNAYITHSQHVILDYQKYEEEFNLELIRSGCDNACNIYRLTTK